MDGNHKQQSFDVQVRRLFFILAGTLAGIYLAIFIWHTLQFFSDIILLFFSAWLISFILSPVANWLQQMKLPRLLAVALVYLLAAALLTGAIALAIPVVSAQVGQIAGRIEILSTPANLQQLNNQAVGFLTNFGVSAADAHNFIDQQTANLQDAAQNTVLGITANAANLVSSVATILLDMVIVLVLSFYMMLDGRRIMDGLIARLPEEWQSDADAFELHVARVFGGFMRSQLIIGFSYGILTWIALIALGVPSGFLIGLLAGIIMIIPFVGPPLSLVPPMALVLLETAPHDLVRTEIILLIILFIGQQLVMQVLAPRIMSQGVGLHPLWLFAALLIGAKEAGVLGAFFAAPIAALVAVVLDGIYERWARTSPLFSENGTAASSPPSTGTLPPGPLPTSGGEGENGLPYRGEASDAGRETKDVYASVPPHSGDAGAEETVAESNHLDRT
jgi:predicted PurR-regulated permease PerM